MKQQIGAVIVNDEQTDLEKLFTLVYGSVPINLAPLDDWRIFALHSLANELIGMLLIGHDGEGHIGILPTFRGKWRMRQTMDALCDFFGVKHTFVGYDTPRARLFLIRNGWKQIGNDERGFCFVRKNNGSRTYS